MPLDVITNVQVLKIAGITALIAPATMEAIKIFLCSKMMPYSAGSVIPKKPVMAQLNPRLFSLGSFERRANAKQAPTTPMLQQRSPRIGSEPTVIILLMESTIRAQWSPRGIITRPNIGPRITPQRTCLYGFVNRVLRAISA